MPPQVTGKQRAARIPLNYYHTPDSLRIWQGRLGWLALALSLGWLGASLVCADHREQLDFYASRAPVAGVHQNWDASCSTCHTSFTPISSNSLGLFWADSKESTKKCQACHAGPDHFKDQSSKDNRTCGSCHREHGGAHVSLVNLPDSDCTSCHRDIKAHGGVKFTENVTRFAKSAHPEFRSIKADPGKLKFSHERHLKAGFGTGMTLNDKILLEEDKKRYRREKQGPDDLIQLDCKSCHQLDASDFGVAAKQAAEFPFNITGKRGAGAYMQPIIYENQCQACHPLKQGELAIPHRMQPKDIHELLESFYTNRVVRSREDMKEKKDGQGKTLPRPLPGKLSKVEVQSITNDVLKAETDLYLSKRLCGECHHFDPKDIVQAIKPNVAPKLKVEPTLVPAVWYQHAKFNHTAHRAVSCVECHSEASGSKSESDVLIPNMDNCVKCHAPKSGTVGGVRHNCTECHQYHHGEQPLQGIGAAQRNPREPQTIQNFLLRK